MGEVLFGWYLRFGVGVVVHVFGVGCVRGVIWIGLVVVDVIESLRCRIA